MVLDARVGPQIQRENAAENVQQQGEAPNAAPGENQVAPAGGIAENGHQLQPHVPAWWGFLKEIQ